MSKKPVFEDLFRGPQDGFFPPGHWTTESGLEQLLEFFARIPEDAPARHADALAAHFLEGEIDPTSPVTSVTEDDEALDFQWSEYESADAKLDTSGGKGKDSSEPGSGNGKAVGKNKNSEDTSTDAGGTTTNTDTTTNSGDTTTDGSGGTTDTSTGTDTTTSSTNGTTADTSGGTTDTSTGNDTTTTGTDGTITDTGGGTNEINTGSTDPNTYVSGLDTPEGFNIELVFEGDWDLALRQVITDTAEALSDLITGDIPSYNGVDDIKIQAYLTDGGALAQGGHFMARDDSFLPSNGFIMLNTAGALTALDGGYLDELVLHEILHAMGFGTSWDSMGLVSDFGGDLRFTGANATEVYNTTYGDIAVDDPLAIEGVPVETDGGAGTAGKHWDEATFGDELMTGSLNGADLLSALSLAALEDMGYETVYGDEPAEDVLIF